MKIINKAIDIVKNEKNNGRLAKFYDCKGLIFRYMGQLDNALEMHTKALLLSNEINDKHGYRKYLNNQGLIFEERANFEKAMEIYAECLLVSKKMNEKRSICVSYCNIGFILEYQGALNQALKYFKRAYSVAKEIKYKAGIGGYGNNIAQIYIKKKNFNKAIPLLSKSYTILISLGIIDSIYCLVGRAYCNMKLNNIELNNDMKLIKNTKIDLTTSNNYQLLWQLFQIYTYLQKRTIAESYIQCAHKALLSRAKNILDNHHKSIFLEIKDAKLIIENIK